MFYDNPNDLELVRNQQNRWISICRGCANKGVDVNLLEPANVAVDDAAIAMAEKPGVDVNAVKGDPIENAGKLLVSLRNLRQSTEKVGRIRTHERRSVEMIVSFNLIRDDAAHEGVVKDLSQGGIRIKTRRHLDRGQVIHFVWKSPLPPALASILQNTAEVRRVVKTDDGEYEVGLRFVNRQAGKGANRRRFRRYKCNMRAYYQREGSEIMARGTVKDISQGGCQMMLDEKMEKEEKFTARLMGGGGSRGDLVGVMQVCRVIPREVEYETGCAFVHMRMGRIDGGADGAAAAKA